MLRGLRGGPLSKVRRFLLDDVLEGNLSPVKRKRVGKGGGERERENGRRRRK